MAITLLRTRLSIDPTAFIARTAVLVGEVSVGPRGSVWYHAVLRGDLAPIEIGADSNIQDGAIVHVEEKIPTRIGERVTVGHNAIVHAADVEDDCLIGIGSILLTGSRIGRGSIVGAGTIIKEGFVVPPGSLVLGVPGRSSVAKLLVIAMYSFGNGVLSPLDASWLPAASSVLVTVPVTLRRTTSTPLMNATNPSS